MCVAGPGRAPAARIPGGGGHTRLAAEGICLGVAALGRLDGDPACHTRPTVTDLQRRCAASPPPSNPTHCTRRPRGRGAAPPLNPDRSQTGDRLEARLQPDTASPPPTQPRKSLGTEWGGRRCPGSCFWPAPPPAVCRPRHVRQRQAAVAVGRGPGTPHGLPTTASGNLQPPHALAGPRASPSSHTAGWGGGGLLTEQPTAAAGKCPPPRVTVAGAFGATCGGAGASLGWAVGRRAEGVAGDACAWRRPRGAEMRNAAPLRAGRKMGRAAALWGVRAPSERPPTAPAGTAAGTEAGSKQAFSHAEGCCVVRLAMTPFLLTLLWWLF